VTTRASREKRAEAKLEDDEEKGRRMKLIFFSGSRGISRKRSARVTFTPNK
jgi:hypothetical protein